MNTTGKFLLGFVAGAVTGAAMALLFAPEKGEDVRKIINEAIDDYATKGKDFYNSKKNEFQKKK